MSRPRIPGVTGYPPTSLLKRTIKILIDLDYINSIRVRETILGEDDDQDEIVARSAISKEEAYKELKWLETAIIQYGISTNAIEEWLYMIQAWALLYWFVYMVGDPYANGDYPIGTLPERVSREDDPRFFLISERSPMSTYAFWLVGSHSLESIALTDRQVCDLLKRDDTKDMFEERIRTQRPCRPVLELDPTLAHDHSSVMSHDTVKGWIKYDANLYIPTDMMKIRTRTLDETCVLLCKQCPYVLKRDTKFIKYIGGMIASRVYTQYYEHMTVKIPKHYRGNQSDQMDYLAELCLTHWKINSKDISSSYDNYKNVMISLKVSNAQEMASRRDMATIETHSMFHHSKTNEMDDHFNKHESYDHVIQNDPKGGLRWSISIACMVSTIFDYYAPTYGKSYIMVDGDIMYHETENQLHLDRESETLSIFRSRDDDTAFLDTYETPGEAVLAWIELRYQPLHVILRDSSLSYEDNPLRHLIVTTEECTATGGMSL